MSSIENITDNELKTVIKKYLQSAPDIFMPGVMIDTVIFGLHNDKLKVLLLRYLDSGFFTLPDGYIKKDESLDDSALRILQDSTGLKNIYLEQFYTSGDINRSESPVAKEILRKIIGTIPHGNWFDQRFISVCYFALVDNTKVTPVPNPFYTEFKWFEVNKLPKTLYDHNAIIRKALKRLQSNLDEKLVGFNLISETFTMGQLQKLYEAVHQKKLLRTNFQRKMLALGVLKRLEKQYNGKSHKAPYLYRFIKSK